MEIKLLVLAYEVLPRDLWEEFERSLGTPQLGPYHYEGPFMGSPGSHLELVLAALEAVKRGEFHPDVPVGVCELMQAAAKRYGVLGPQYALLHDLDKINCLTFVYTDERVRVPVPYAKWQQMLYDDPDGPGIMALSGEALRRFCERHNIRQISYYQKVDGRDRTHGSVTAQRLRGRLDIPGIVVRAIRTHAIAFQFKARGGLNLPLFEETFANWPEIELGFALLVNYADQMGSRTVDGQPDIVSFVALARTFLAFLKFGEIHRRVMGETKRLNKRDEERREALFRALRGSKNLLETETVDESVRRILTACTVPSRG